MASYNGKKRNNGKDNDVLENRIQWLGPCGRVKHCGSQQRFKGFEFRNLEVVSLGWALCVYMYACAFTCDARGGLYVKENPKTHLSPGYGESSWRIWRSKINTYEKILYSVYIAVKKCVTETLKFLGLSEYKEGEAHQCRLEELKKTAYEKWPLSWVLLWV